MTIKYQKGLCRITNKNNETATIELNTYEARALMEKLMWLKILNIQEVTHEHEYTL